MTPSQRTQARLLIDAATTSLDAGDPSEVGAALLAWAARRLANDREWRAAKKAMRAQRREREALDEQGRRNDRGLEE